MSNWIRLVSLAHSPFSDGFVELGRTVTGDGVSSSGFGCIKINGNSATSSLKIIITINHKKKSLTKYDK